MFLSFLKEFSDIEGYGNVALECPRGSVQLCRERMTALGFTEVAGSSAKRTIFFRLGDGFLALGSNAGLPVKLAGYSDKEGYPLAILKRLEEDFPLH